MPLVGRKQAGQNWGNIFLAIFFLLAFPLATGATPGRGFVVEATTASGDKQQIHLYDSSQALLIGAGKYTAGWPNLESVEKELNKLQQALEENGFSVTRVDNPNAKILQTAFEDFIDQYGYQPNNRLLFYFSGHGYTRKEGEKGYLVPIDAPDPLKDERGFLKKALPMSQVLAWARDIEAKHALFMFDSCFSGTVFKQKNFEKPPEHIRKIAAKPVRQFITAGSAGEAVPALSVFTPAFVDALIYGRGDLNKDGYISGTELGLYLQQEVPRHINQTPQYGKISDYQLSRGDFIFLAGGDLGDVSSSELPFSQPAYRVNAEEEMWLAVRDSGNLSDLETYLAEYPDGRFSTVASLKIRKIHDAVTPSTLTVKTKPSAASVRILDIKEQYTPGMRLHPGNYKIEISAAGHQTIVKSIDLPSSEEFVVSIVLPLLVVKPAVTAPVSASTNNKINKEPEEAVSSKENSDIRSTLTVNSTPSDARTRILNIVPKYEPGMALDPGGYKVEVSHFGYETVILDIELAAGEDLNIPVSLQKIGIPAPNPNPNVMIPEGKSTDVLYLSSASGQDEKIPLGFTIHCDLAEMEFDEDGTALHIKSELVVLQKKNEILRKSLKGAGHFSYEGFTFHQTSYQPYKSMVIRIKSTMTGVEKTFYTEFQQETFWPEEGLRFGIVNVELVKIKIESAQKIVNRLKVWFSDNKGGVSVFWIRPNEEKFMKRQDGDYVLSVRQHYGIGLTRIPEKL